MQSKSLGVCYHAVMLNVFCFSRYIGQVNPQLLFFNYMNEGLLDQSISGEKKSFLLWIRNHWWCSKTRRFGDHLQIFRQTGCMAVCSPACHGIHIPWMLWQHRMPDSLEWMTAGVKLTENYRYVSITRAFWRRIPCKPDKKLRNAHDREGYEHSYGTDSLQAGHIRGSWHVQSIKTYPWS